MTTEPDANRKPEIHRRHDWIAIKRRYVEGYEVDGARYANPTMEEIAGHFEIHLSVVKKAAMREKWTDQRELFQSRLEVAQRERTTNVLASKGAEFDALSLRVAEKLFKKIEHRIDQAMKTVDAIDLTPAQASQLAAAAKAAQHVGRLVMGDSTDNARLYAELLQKPDLSALSAAELEQLETLLTKAKPGGA
jgi:hypothetical protein